MFDVLTVQTIVVAIGFVVSFGVGVIAGLLS